MDSSIRIYVSDPHAAVCQLAELDSRQPPPSRGARGVACAVARRER